MENGKYKKNANKIMWVQYWLESFDKAPERRDNSKSKRFSSGDNEIVANLNSDKKWVCEIDIPLVNKTVKAVALTEIDAMIKAAEKAAKLIDAYLVEHPELKIRNKFKNGHWQIVGDENGNFLEIGLSPEARKRNGLEIEKMIMDSFKAVEGAIAKLKKINGSTKNMFIQVIDKNLIQPKTDKYYATKSITQVLMEGYGVEVYAINCIEVDDKIIAIGYTAKDI